MKKILLTIFFLIFCFLSFAQKELWGYNKSQFVSFNTPDGIVTVPYYGNITKYDINGQNAKVVHTFDGINGKLPNGKLFQASNGKLYGLTSVYTSSTGQNDDAYLFEYDLILNKFRNVHTFDHNTFYDPQLMQSGVIEGLPCKLYGAISTSFFCYDFINETTTTHVLNNYNASLTGELMKASDGFLYGTIFEPTPCPSLTISSVSQGGIVKINPTNNTSQVKYLFSCGTVDGTYPTGRLIEADPNILFGTALGGGDVFYNTGSLFTYNILTNTFSKKQNFDDGSIGAAPISITSGTNGKIYGVCYFGGSVITPPNNSFNYYGSVFEYTPATNIINQVYSFSPIGMSTNAIRPQSIMKASTGFYFGISEAGIFKFNPLDNSVITPTPFGCTNCPVNELYANVSESLIEICRKPSYQEFIVNTFSPAVVTAFTYDVNNTNAATYVWKKGTTVLPTQTTGVLNLPSVSLSDTGVYTCTMTNECGTTITANLNINVTNLSTETIDDYKQLISLYPNPTKGILNLKFPENRGLKGISYKIINLLGQVILENDISKSNKTELAIDTSGFANGVYQLSLITDKGNWNGKFVKD
jgi:hypothetical protein